MLLSNGRDERSPKNIIFINQLPVYIDKDQPPTKKEPFRTICNQHYCHCLSVLASTDYAAEGLQQVLDRNGTLHYARVHMKLLDVVSGAFFDDYIKTGNILMLSEGRLGIDETYTLREGILRLEVDRPTYERLGLTGNVIESKGRKHVKARYAIELNLRLPSMVRGQKGFERILRAFTNVLVDTKTWLFVNLKAPADLTGPISTHVPTTRAITSALQRLEGVLTPAFALEDDLDVESILELQEWLSLLTISSPRVTSTDKIDSYLSRYQVPRTDGAGVEAQQPISTEVLRTEWRGLLHVDFIKTLYMSLLKAGTSTGWLAMSAHAFDGSSYTIIRQGKRVVVCQYMD
ncbi:hypothetical protein AMS68_007754 [Peltaster fructicola]|uniref:Uncharacterized protein n=1 Tax=Peltaster fructicola TaxID=286661 RepID=A0A6H0Y5B0_9PEZI|nr:hypothetical protein AMS68_007754 [Peltaster fructicola]